MSADKLRALDEAMTPGPWERWDDVALRNALPDLIGWPEGFTVTRLKAAATLIAALPELIAVVEAAERSHDHRQAMVGGVCETCAALAALNEKLGGEQP